jgi:hypothetical protein
MDGILHLISQYGYLIILFGVMAQNTGVPWWRPSDICLGHGCRGLQAVAGIKNRRGWRIDVVHPYL